MKHRSRLAISALLSLAIVLSIAPLASAADQPLGVQDVDVSEYPQVRISVTMPPSIDGSDIDFEVSENEIGVDRVKATSLSREEMPSQVVLVIDTSGSMKGQPLDEAKKAAGRFIEEMGSNASIAIVAFDDKPRVISNFTSERYRLDEGLASLMAEGETSLYDALVKAAAMLPAQGDARRSMIVLSDGGDTVSNASFEKTVAELEKTGVPLYAVALKSDEYNPNALSVLAKRTGGRLVPVSKATELTSLFEGIAAEITNAWVVEYTSLKPRTADVEVDVKASSGDIKAAASLAYSNPGVASLAASSKGLTIPEIEEDSSTLIAVVLFGFIAVSMLAAGVMLILLRDRPNLDQLTFYDQLNEQAAPVAGDDLKAKVVDAVGYVAGQRGMMQLASARLEAAGLPLRPAEYMTGHILLVIAVGVLFELAIGRFMLALGAVLLATALPMLVIVSMAERRRSRFQEQLPDVLNMISGSLRAGWGVQQAIALAVQEVPEPSATEFRRVETETRLGMPLERAMGNMADRMDSDDFRAVVTAIGVQREIGGNLAEVLDIVSKTIREREAVRRQVRSLTAEGRLSAYILVALPFLVFGVLMIVNPSYILPLLVSPIGIAMLVFAVFLLVVGTIWVFAVTKIEV